MPDCNCTHITEEHEDVVIREKLDEVHIVNSEESVTVKTVTEPVTVKEEKEEVVIREGPRAYVYIGPSPNWIYEEIVLTAAQIASKSIYLQHTPADPESVELEAKGAPNLIHGNAFTVTGSTISWDGNDIDGILAEDDIVGIRYVIF